MREIAVSMFSQLVSASNVDTLSHLTMLPGADREVY